MSPVVDRGIVVVALVLSQAGCLAFKSDQDAVAARVNESERQLAAARAEIAATKADLEATRQRLDNALRANAESTTDTMSTKQRLNDLAGRVDEAKHGIEELRRDVTQSRTEIYARIDDLKRGQAPAPAPPPVSVPADKATHYRQIEEA